MIAQLLIYDDLEEDTYIYFHFVANEIQAGYKSADDLHYCVVIGGSIYELKYDKGLEIECQRIIKFKDAYNNLL